MKSTESIVCRCRLEFVSESPRTFHTPLPRHFHAALHNQMQKDNAERANRIHNDASAPLVLNDFGTYSSDSAVGEPFRVLHATISGLSREACVAIDELVARLRRDNVRVQIGFNEFRLIDSAIVTPLVTTIPVPILYSDLWRTAAAGTLITLTFRTPTVFRHKNKDILSPLPEYVFERLARRWNYFSDIPLRALSTESIRADVRLLHAETTISSWELKPEKRQQGFVGSAAYLISGSPELRQELAVVASFATYAGVGGRTPYGMGQVLRG